MNIITLVLYYAKYSLIKKNDFDSNEMMFFLIVTHTQGTITILQGLTSFMMFVLLSRFPVQYCASRGPPNIFIAILRPHASAHLGMSVRQETLTSQS